MNSEKVKEIKECLEVLNEYGETYITKDKTQRKFVKYADILTYINELESENEILRNAKVVYENVDYCFEDLKKAEKRIAELEKENAIKTDTIVDLLKKQEFYEKEKLTKFAERLKSKDCSVPIHKGFILIEDHAIDETLKEFTNGKE